MYGIFFEEAGKEDGKDDRDKFHRFIQKIHRNIKKYNKSWRKIKPSTGKGMINIGLIIILKSVIKYGYISTRIE
jgi:hypothetical protein